MSQQFLSYHLHTVNAELIGTIEVKQLADRFAVSEDLSDAGGQDELAARIVADANS